jgi:hypothetical protein
LFQCLCWPAKRSHPRERSRERGKSSRQGGRHHGRDRSREWSLDHRLHRFHRHEQVQDSSSNDIRLSPQRGCKPLPSLQKDSPDSGSAGLQVAAMPNSPVVMVILLSSCADRKLVAFLTDLIQCFRNPPSASARWLPHWLVCRSTSCSLWGSWMQPPRAPSSSRWTLAAACRTSCRGSSSQLCRQFWRLL